jgi:type IV pilus assembly protein PilB
MTPEKPLRLGEILIQAGIIDKLQLNTALKYQREWDRKLGESLVELGFISEQVLAKVLSKFLEVPSVELTQTKISPLAIQKVPRRLAEKYGLMPLDVIGEPPRATLLVAMIDPTNLVAIDEVAFTSACKVKAVVATHTDVDQAIRRHYGDDRIVDVFFDRAEGGVIPLDEGQPPARPQLIPGGIAVRNRAPLEAPVATKDADEMVILQRGEESRLVMPPVRSSQPEPLELPFDWESIAPDALLRILIKILMRKGVVTADALEREFRREEGKES